MTTKMTAKGGAGALGTRSRRLLAGDERDRRDRQRDAGEFGGGELVAEEDAGGREAS